MSLTSRLFLAMVICRAFMLGPQPCNRCWVKLRLSDEVVAGLKSLRGLLLLTPVLFNPRLRVVPVRNDCWIAKLAIFCCWMSSLLPVLNALLCGVVKWPQLRPLVNNGSRLGIAGPEEEIAAEPTALAVALLESAPALTLVPAVVPELDTEALDGPANTPVERSEEHTSELQSLRHLVCRLLLETQKLQINARPDAHVADISDSQVVEPLGE